MPTLESTLQAIESYGLVVLFLLAIVEGPIVTVIAAYVASLGHLNIVSVYAVVVVSDLVGDSICYGLGRMGDEFRIMRWGARMGVTKIRLAKLKQQFHVSGGKILLVGKLTHAAGFPILVAAGVSRMSYPSFLWFNLLGTLPKSFFFLLVGYTLGYAYKDIDVYISRASFAVLIAAACAGLLYWVHKWKTKD